MDIIAVVWVLLLAALGRECGADSEMGAAGPVGPNADNKRCLLG